MTTRISLLAFSAAMAFGRIFVGLIGRRVLDRLAGDGFQSSSRNSVAWFEFHVHALRVYCSICYNTELPDEN